LSQEETGKKKRFIVKEHIDPSTGIWKKDVFIDSKLFEYEVDMDSIVKAKSMGPRFILAAQRDIQRHFLECLSEFMGRAISVIEVQEAIKTGWI
jgi:hypothetical protein